MSVREGDRQESNLKYIQDAEKLCAHTLQICNNPKHFPEPALANQMKEEAIQVLCGASKVRESLVSFLANAQHGNTHHTQYCMKQYYCELTGSDFNDIELQKTQARRSA